MPGTRPWWRAELPDALEIVALCGFVVTQPVLDVFGRSPDVFLFRNAGRADVVAFALLLAVVAPLAVAGAAALTRLAGPRARRAAQLAVVGGGALLLASQVAKKAADLDTAPTAALAVLGGGAFLAAYLRFPAVGLWMRYAAPATLLFAALFLFVAPTSKLVLASEVRAADVPAGGRTPPVVMLVLDELPTATIIDPDGSINERLFPNFARLAATSTWFRDFTTVSNQTWHAIPSLLSGRAPAPDKAPIAADHPENLFTLLGGIYDVRATETITRLCPDSVCTGGSAGGGGLRRLLRDAGEVWREVTRPSRSQTAVSASLVEETAGEAAAAAAGFRPGIDVAAGFAANVPSRFSSFLDGLGTDPTRPRPFDYLHVLLPHEAWRYYPSGRQYVFPSEGIGRVGGGDTWEDDPRAVELGRQRHLLQARYTDRLLGELLDTLEERAVLDRTLLVVVADHGIGLQPGLPARALDEDPPALAPETFPELAWAPFFVKEPGQRAGRVDDTNVQLVDVVPTVADLLDVDIPWPVDGVSAFASGPRPPKTMAKSTSGAFGPSVEPAVPIDAARWRPLVPRRSAARFVAPGDPDLAIYRAGEYGALVGTPVEDAATGPPSGRRVHVDGAGAFASVDLDGAPLPGLVTGAFEDGRAGVVAIALNGRVAGVSPTFPDRGRPGAFAAVLPDAFFRDGANELSRFVVTGGPARPVLHPVPG